MMAQRGLSASQPGCVRIPILARSLNAPLQRSYTLMQLSRSSILESHLATRGRAIHFGTTRKNDRASNHVRFSISGAVGNHHRDSLDLGIRGVAVDDDLGHHRIPALRQLAVEFYLKR